MRTRDYIRKYCVYEKNALYSKTTRAWISIVFASFLARHEITELYSFHDCWKTNKSNVACCGFSKKEQRWYGWTHRGVRSFGIGDTYFNYFGGKPAKTLEVCKKLALYAVKELD